MWSGFWLVEIMNTNWVPKLYNFFIYISYFMHLIDWSILKRVSVINSSHNSFLLHQISSV
jgi:hypothetical protein